MREKAIEALKEHGFNAIEEGGVLMILFDGPESKFGKTFRDACVIANYAGYKASIGIRKIKSKEGEEE